MITSLMTYWYPGVFDVIRIVREIFPGIPVILGGIYATLCPEHALQSGADYVLTGEGELQIRFIIEDLLHRKIEYLPVLSELDSLPYPAFDLLPYKEQLPIMTSRGCPFRCTYCASHILNSSFRRRSPNHVAEEITFWNRNFGIRHFSFYDDAFLINSEDTAIPLMKEIIRRDLSCQFHCPNGLHLRTITAKISRLMYGSGFRTLRFGFETSDSERQLRTGGKVSNEHLHSAFSYLKEAGYAPQDIGLYFSAVLPNRMPGVEESIRLFFPWAPAHPGGIHAIPEQNLDKAVATSSYDNANEPLFHNNSLLHVGMNTFLRRLPKLKNTIRRGRSDT
jgi:radical SAM superfamily enzyme YgiQ (UPF0313 family)